MKANYSGKAVAAAATNPKKVRGEDKSVERLAQGRKEKERVNQILKDGYWNFVQQKNVKKPDGATKKAAIAKRPHEYNTNNGGEERVMKKVFNFCMNFCALMILLIPP